MLEPLIKLEVEQWQGWCEVCIAAAILCVEQPVACQRFRGAAREVVDGDRVDGA
jgi:hypothetical protein